MTDDRLDPRVQERARAILDGELFEQVAAELGAHPPEVALAVIDAGDLDTLAILRRDWRVPRLRAALEHERRRLDPDFRAAAERRAAERAARVRRIARRAVIDHARALVTTIDRSMLIDGRHDRAGYVQRVDAWLAREERPPLLVLAGPPGVGKSIAAVHALVELAVRRAERPIVRRWRGPHGERFTEQEYTLPPAIESAEDEREYGSRAAGLVGGFVTTADVLSRGALHRWARPADREPVLSAATLVIDDLGCEPKNEIDVALAELLDAREGRAEADTIITTNLTKSALAERYDARLVSRLQRGELVALRGRDRRRRGAGWAA